MQAVQKGVQVKVATAAQHAPPEQQADASDVKAMARGLDLLGLVNGYKF